MGKVLISLLGGRGIPNMQGFLYTMPDNMYAVASKDSQENLKNLLAAMPKKLKISTKLVSPYDMYETLEICRYIVNKHLNDEIIINLASEPKLMSIGAFTLAKELDSEGKKIKVLCYTRDGIVDVLSNSKPTRIKIGIQKYFQAYGWNVKYKQDKSWVSGLAKYFVDNLPLSHELLHKMRVDQNEEKNNNGKYFIKEPLTTEELKILEKLQNMEWIENIEKNNQGIYYYCKKDKFKILNGEWLEYYVYDIAKNLLDDNNQSLFDECAWTVKDNDNKAEIDFVGLRAGEIIIASCKDRPIVKVNYLKELDSVAEQIGGSMCTKLYITTAKQEFDENKIRWFEERKIVPVFIDELNNLSKIIQEQVIKPKYPRR